MIFFFQWSVISFHTDQLWPIFYEESIFIDITIVKWQTSTWKINFKLQSDILGDYSRDCWRLKYACSITFKFISLWLPLDHINVTLWLSHFESRVFKIFIPAVDLGEPCKWILIFDALNCTWISLWERWQG